MKRADLKIGIIVEDRSEYSQKYTQRPFFLIIRVDVYGFSAITSAWADYFEVWDNNSNIYRSESWRPVRMFKKVTL